MPKFIINWDVGYGPKYEIIEAPDMAAAEEQAEKAWLNAVDDFYGAEEYSKERAQELEIEDEGERGRRC